MGTETSHFWVGRFENKKSYYDFVGERDDYYEDESKQNEKYISAFAESQAEHWLDHDFMESGFEEKGNGVTEKFKDYSYGEEWIATLEERTTSLKQEEINTMIMIRVDQISNPTSVNGAGFYLVYVGTIEYAI